MRADVEAFRELPFDSLPTDWQVASLSQVCTSSREMINPTGYPEEPFEYYSIPAFQQSRGPVIAYGRDVLSQKLLVEDGTVLFGKLNPRVPKVWRVRSKSPHRKIASSEFLALLPGSDLDGDFLTFLCWSTYVMEVSKGLVGGSTPSRQRVDPAAFYEIKVPVPPLAEQRMIAAVLLKIQAAVEVQEKIVSTLGELKAATMAKLFREGLRGEPLKQTEIGEIPESWEVIRLGSISERINYGTSTHCSTEQQGRPVLRIPNVIHERIETSELKYANLTKNEIERLSLRVGDLLFVRTNGNRHYTGRCAVYVGEPEDALFASYLIRARLVEGTVLPEFAQTYFSAVGREQITSRANPAADGKYNIDTRILKDLSLPRPSVAEQKGITRIVRLIECRLVRVEERLRASKALFSAMLELLMAGRVRVRSGVEAKSGGPEESSRRLVLEKVDRYVAELVRRFEPERVILFGQHVEGSPRAFGEVGLLVEMEFAGLARDQAAQMAHEIPHEFSLDLVVRRPADVARAIEIGDAFIKGVLERGRTLYLPAGGARSRREKAPREEKPPREGHVSEETLGEIVQRIVEAVQPEKIILFGSAARGEMGPDSDVDLLVVKPCANRRETATAIYRNLRGVGVPIDIVVVTPEDVERHKDTIGYIIRPALREGRIVYAS